MYIYQTFSVSNRSGFLQALANGYLLFRHNNGAPAKFTFQLVPEGVECESCPAYQAFSHFTQQVDPAVMMLSKSEIGRGGASIRNSSFEMSSFASCRLIKVFVLSRPSKETL
jgi:hypothetical protein